MEELIEILAFFSSITALFSVLALIILRIYLSIRRCFPISVNCWFCNKWSRVPYDSRNCFECKNCSQYNGFTEDGGYNKIIEAQHRSIKTPISNSPKNSNGLCTSCNHNQQLKISQLAMFTPLVEENYDEEIEHFRIQLEKAYKLCSPCRRFLKTTLLREKASFFGNHVYNIQKKGINIYEKLLKKSNANETSSRFLKVLKRIQGILAILIIFKISCRILLSVQPERFPDYLLPYLEFYHDISKTLQKICTQLISASCFSSAAAEYIHLKAFCFVGFFMQILSFPMEQTPACIKINQILCWSFLALVSWTNSQEMLMSSFQIVCACLIFYNSFYKFEINPRAKITMKKLPRSCDNSNYSEDISDNEDFTSSHEDTLINRNMTDKFTANHIFNRKMENNCNVDSFIQSHREDLHPSKSLFEFDKADLLSFSTSSLNKKQRPISPATLNNLDQNMWVAGGFWKCADGTIIPINQGGKKSYSPSSGFFSQANNDFTKTFSNGQHFSLPASVETSLSGDFERLSIAPKSPYTSPSGSPLLRTPNTSYVMSPFGSPPVRSPISNYAVSPSGSPPMRSHNSSYAMPPSGFPPVRHPNSNYAMSPSGSPRMRSPNSTYAMLNIPRPSQPLPSWTSDIHYMGYNRPMGNLN